MTNPLTTFMLAAGLLMTGLPVSADAPPATDPPAAGSAAESKSRAPIEAAALAPLTRELVEGLADAVDRRGGGGAGLALIVDGEVRWVDTRGYGNRDTDARFTATTPIPIGEASRLVTAALAMRLVADGRVALDAPIREVLPEPRIAARSGDAAGVTLRQLLAHQSGLKWTELRGAWSPHDIEPMPLDWARALEQVQPAGRMTIVSNLGYALAGSVLEAATGAPYAALVAAEIAEPLALATLATATPTDTAFAHRDDRIEPAWRARDVSAQGIVSSLADLAALAAALDPGNPRAARWLDPEARTEMTRAQNLDLALDLGNRQGIAWALPTSVRPGVGRIAVSVGVGFGFRAEVRLALDHGLGVVAVSNDDEATGALFDLSADALDGLLALRAGTPKRDRERPLPETIALPAGATAAEPARRYATPGGEIRIAPRVGGGFRADAAGLRFRADPRADRWWRLRYDLLGVLPIGFERINRVAIAPVRVDGIDALVGFSADRYVLLGTAHAPTAAIDAEALVGEYRLVNPDRLVEDAEIDRVTLVLDEGELVARYTIPFVIDLTPTIRLVPLDRDTFVTAGIGPNQGETLRFDRSGPEPAFTYSGYRFERLAER